VFFTTNVMSSNPTHGKVYSIQYYMIKFVSDLRQVGGYSGGVQNYKLKKINIIKWIKKDSSYILFSIHKIFEIKFLFVRSVKWS
jgi:hypothetical protein